jgi:hypothetical protein
MKPGESKIGQTVSTGNSALMTIASVGVIPVGNVKRRVPSVKAILFALLKMQSLNVKHAHGNRIAVIAISLPTEKTQFAAIMVGRGAGTSHPAMQKFATPLKSPT